MQKYIMFTRREDNSWVNYPHDITSMKYASESAAREGNNRYSKYYYLFVGVKDLQSWHLNLMCKLLMKELCDKDM
jgi:hypothetical protein